MTLASIHPMFQVSINFCNYHSLLNSTRSHIVDSVCQIIGIWKCMLECQDWSPSMFIFVNFSHCIFLWHGIFEKAFTVKGGVWRKGGNFVEHIFLWSASQLPKKHFFDYQNGIWQVLKTPMLNISFTVDVLRASPPCRVKGSWQALWRSLGEEKSAPPLSNPMALIARALQPSGSTHYPCGWALHLLRPHSGASSTCDPVNCATFGNHVIFMTV